MVRYKYTPEALAEAAAQARSITEVMRLLGVRISGGSHAHISRQLKRFGIDTSHFTGQAHNKGQRGTRRTTSSQLLLRLPGGSRRTPGTRLKWALSDIGVPAECEKCGVGPMWRGQPLTLHVDHVNGDFLDNRPPNLRLLCPNCHSQTDTFAGRNKRTPPPVEPRRATAPTPPTRHGPLAVEEVEEVVRLVTAPHAPRSAPTSVRDELVVNHALANPGLGPRKLAEVINTASAGECSVSHGTVSNILRRAGLHTASARRSRLIGSAGVA